MKLTVGITDSNGFVGSHLSVALRTAGFRVVGLELGELLGAGPLLKAFVKKSDVIVHVADIKRGEASEVAAGSVDATLHLLHALKSTAAKKKFIFLSSTQADSDSVYGKSKVLAEILIRDYSEKNNAQAMVIRLPNMFGEGKKPFHSSVVATFCYQLQHGQQLKVDASARDKKINLLYIGDVVRLLMRFITGGGPMIFTFTTFAATKSITVQKLADLLSSFKVKGLRQRPKFYKELYKTYLSYE